MLKDMILFAIGTMTQNSTHSSMTKAPVMNCDIKNRGYFTLWEKLATKREDFGQFVELPGNVVLL
ncbi:oleate hydratase [Sharpea azabuensis]|uniref:oleate hydratase n=1 Tax=Sharpea azabuensis TaxID=322505 RepID=UPI0023F0559D|nr:oleate hydratase [Sharpea azabuensis]